MKNILIVGQGAIGLLWYYHLVNTNNDNKEITLLTSQSDNQLAQQVSCTLLSDVKNSVPLHRANNNSIKNAELILICVKSFQVADVLKQIQPQLNSQAKIVLSHNGMGVIDELTSDFINQQHLFTLLTTHGCKREASFDITHTGSGNSDIGQLCGDSDTASNQQIVKILDNALSSVYWQDNIIIKQWTKLAINCVINPLTSLHNCINGEISKLEYQPLIKQLLNEIVTLAKCENITLNEDSLYITVLDVADKTYQNSSSMRCDVLAGKPTEIDYINGYIHRLGKKWNIATPANSQIWQQIKNLS